MSGNYQGLIWWKLAIDDAAHPAFLETICVNLLGCRSNLSCGCETHTWYPDQEAGAGVWTGLKPW